MIYELGPQYNMDFPFKATARLHQSRYRAKVLQVDYDEYGSRLSERDGRRLLNYYNGMNVRETLRIRYPNYSKNRDANMLRSEHIPFNLFSPLVSDNKLALSMLEKAFHIKAKKVTRIEFELAPKPIEYYLNDGTAFDIYIEYLNSKNEHAGLGIEVKYTERDYPLKDRERKNIGDPNSRYWEQTRTSGLFNDPTASVLGSDPLRQIWRNHLLGLSMIDKDDIMHFSSITLFPDGNKHFREIIPKYQSLLKDGNKNLVWGCTYEKYINAISGGKAILEWKQYLEERYLINQVE